MANEQKNDGSSSSNNNSPNKNISTNPSSSTNPSNNAAKPKQPQRGLGVAQLEKIRLESQMANYGFISPYDPAFQGPFPTSHRFQEELRMQAGYQAYRQAQLLASPAAQFTYGPPPADSSSIYGYPNNVTMGTGEHMQRTGNIIIGEPQPYMASTRWNPNANVAIPENPYYMEANNGMVTRPLLDQVEQNARRGNFMEPRRSNSYNADSSDDENEEIDLELKL